MNWIADYVLKPLGSLLVGLLTVESLGPFFGVFALLIVETVVSMYLLPKSPPPGLCEDDKAWYRNERARLFVTRKQRLIIFFFCWIAGFILSAVVVTSLDHVENWVSGAVGVTLVAHTWAIAARADTIFEELRKWRPGGSSPDEGTL